jgi:hypothetical protein
LNGLFLTQPEDIRNRADSIDAAIQASIEIFGLRHVSRKWLGDRYEPRINRAILDVLVYYFADPAIREAALVKRQAIVNAFQYLFTDGTEFRDAVESTTKSLRATYERYALWGKALASVLPVLIPVPQWDDARNRIIAKGERET